MNWFTIWVLAVLGLSCTGSLPAPREEAPVLRAWAPLRTTAPSKRTAGEDCSATGAHGCDEGVYLRFNWRKDLHAQQHQRADRLRVSRC